METWMKIGSAFLMLIMIFFIWPAARNAMKNAPKGTSAQWLNAFLLIGGVMLFVLILMKLV